MRLGADNRVTRRGCPQRSLPDSVGSVHRAIAVAVIIGTLVGTSCGNGAPAPPLEPLSNPPGQETPTSTDPEMATAAVTPTTRTSRSTPSVTSVPRVTAAAEGSGAATGPPAASSETATAPEAPEDDGVHPATTTTTTQIEESGDTGTTAPEQAVAGDKSGEGLGDGGESAESEGGPAQPGDAETAPPRNAYRSPDEGESAGPGGEPAQPEGGPAQPGDAETGVCAGLAFPASLSCPADLPAHVALGARDFLATELGVPESALLLTVAEAVTWVDGSLGCMREGYGYTAAEEPGFRFMFSHGDDLHAVHTTDNGSWFVRPLDCVNPGGGRGWHPRSGPPRNPVPVDDVL